VLLTLTSTQRPATSFSQLPELPAESVRRSMNELLVRIRLKGMPAE
jgi:hypothetical protein